MDFNEYLKQFHPKIKSISKTNDDVDNILTEFSSLDNKMYHMLIEKNTTNTKLFYSGKLKSNPGNFTIQSDLLSNASINTKRILKQTKPLGYVSDNSDDENEKILYKLCKYFKNDAYLNNCGFNKFIIECSRSNPHFSTKATFELLGDNIVNLECEHYAIKQKYSERDEKELKLLIKEKILAFVLNKLCCEMGFHISAKDYSVFTKLTDDKFLFHFENPINIYGNNNTINLNFSNNLQKLENNVSDIKNYIFKKFPNLNEKFVNCGKDKFAFDENTGIWKKLNKHGSLHYFLKFINENFTNEEFNISYAETNLNNLTHLIETQLYNPDFVEQFDVNLHLLGLKSTKSEIFNLKTNQFIKSNLKDYVSFCCKWVYNEDEATKYYNDVKKFIEDLFPIEQVRFMTMKWLACSLDGSKNDKTMLILTDESGGDNGKSSFLHLISLTFDEYCTNGFKYLTTPRCASRNNNVESQSSGTKALKNKRLMYSDELQPHHKLDASEINYLISGFSDMSGRSFGSSERFSFNSTASILVACNENKFPNFDPYNVNLTKRFLVVKMLAKFDEDNRKLKLHLMLPLWRSAFFKYLMSEFFCNKGFNKKYDVPEKVKIYTQELINSRMKNKFFEKDLDVENKLKKFIDSKLIYTENKYESCTINDLKILLKEFGLGDLFKSKQCIAEIRSMLRLSGLTVLENNDWMKNGISDRRKNKILNMKLKNI